MKTEIVTTLKRQATKILAELRDTKETVLIVRVAKKEPKMAEQKWRSRGNFIR